MKTTLLLLWLTLSSTLLFSQADVFYAKGKEYYDKDQKREALYYFKKFIRLDSSKAEVFKWRGNCYSDLNQLDSAKRDYETALRLNPSMHEVHYNLSGIFRAQKKMPEAKRAMKTYLTFEPDDVDGLLGMGELVREDAPDSALYYFKKAYQSDPKDINVVMSLALEYYYAKNYIESLKITTGAWKDHRLNSDLAGLITETQFAIPDYQQTIAWADTLLKFEPESLEHFVTKARAQVLLATDANLIARDGFLVRFKNITNTRLDELDRKCSDPASPYYYKTLQEKFNQNITLGLDQYFMLYYGFTQDSRYSPYGATRISFNDDFENKDYGAIIRKCEEGLKHQPYSTDLFEALSIAQFRMGMKDAAMINLRKHLGIMESIMATGTGRSYQEAYIVTSPSHEYDLLDYLGLESMQQSLANKDGHSYDILKAKLEDETTLDIYFNIDKPFGSLGGMLKSQDKADKGKKKKKD